MNRVDVKCRICLSILIKPVILPCTHEFCLECFEKHLRISSGKCPLCRRRVGSWARNAKRNNGLVNEIRWQTIKKNFPDRVNKRLNNLETSSDTEADSDIEMIMAKQKNIEHLKMKDKEVIDKLQGADHATLNAVPRVSSADKPGCSGVTKPCTQSTTTSTLEPPKQLPKRSASVESVDSISPELNHFRPIKSEPKTPPRRAPQEPIVLKPCTMIAKPRNLTTDLTDDAAVNSRSFPAPLTSLLPRWLQMTSADNSNKRSETVNKSDSEKEPERKDDAAKTKKSAEKTNKSAEKVSVPPKGLKRRKRVESVVNENTATMGKRRSTCTKRQQEMDDFKLALKIQRNINKGVYDVDRSCSGDRPYFLRKRNPQSS